MNGVIRGPNRNLIAVRVLSLVALVVLPGICLINSARAEPGKSGAEAATREFTVAKSLQARQHFGPAAEEWTRFLQNHASDSRAAEAQYNLGVCRFRDKKFDAAAAAFVQLITSFPKSEHRASAWLNLALAQHNQAAGGQPELYAKAADNLAKYLKQFPNHAEAPRGAFFLAEALNASGKKAQAAEAYTQMIAKYPRDSLVPDALYALGATQEELGQMAAAGGSYDAYLKQFPAGPQAAEVTLRRGETLFAQKQYEAAREWFAAAAARPGFADADLALFRQAAALYEQRQYGAAAEIYASIGRRFPQSKLLQAAQLAAGKCAGLAGDLDRARERLTDLIAVGGAMGAEAAHWLAQTYLQQQKPQEAIQVVERALPAAAETSFAVQLALDRADALYQQPATRRESLAAYAAIAGDRGHDPLAPRALSMAALAALNIGECGSAADYSNRFLKQYAGHEFTADVEYVSAEANLQLRKHDEAIAAYDRLLNGYPRRPEAPTWRIRRGLALFSKKDYAQVVASLKALLASPHAKGLVAEASYLVGASQNELKQYEAAARSLSAGLAAEPRGQYAADTLMALALAERQLNQTAEAQRHLRRVVDEFADQPLQDRAHFQLAEMAYAAGDSTTAQAEYKLVAETFPHSPLAPKALFALAWARLAARDFNGAVAALDTLLAKHADSELTPRARYARGLARVELKDFALALDDVRAFLQSSPAGDDLRNAQYVLGVCQAGLKQTEEAEKTFRAILAENPRYAGGDKVLYELAVMLRSLGRGEQAQDAFRQLAEQYTASSFAAEALFEVGEAEYEAGGYLAAAAAFHKSMQKAGKSSLGERAAHRLGQAQFRQNDFDKARRTFIYQLATWPQGNLADDAAFMTGEAFFRQGKYADALPYYQRVKHPSDGDFAALAALHAAQAQGRLKQWQASLATLGEATAQFSDSKYLPELLCEEAWAEQNLGRLDLAMKRYEEVAARSEAEVAARARFMIGEIYVQKAQYDKAIKNFIKVAYGYGYPRWQAEAHYEAGVCYETLGKKDQAIKSYREVAEKFADSGKAAPAKRRLAALGAAK